MGWAPDNINYSLVQKSATHRLKYRVSKSLIPEKAEHSEFPLKLLNAVGTEHQSGLVPKVAVPQLFANYEEMHSIFIHRTSLNTELL